MTIKTFYIFLGLLFFPLSLKAADQEQQYKGVSFVCTGVGESKEDPKWKVYPLKLMFTGSGRAYVSEVKAEIKDASGQTVLKTECDGPWLLVKLKPGKYQIQASADGGGTKTSSVTVPEVGQNELVMRFSSIPQGKGNDL